MASYAVTEFQGLNLNYDSVNNTVVIDGESISVFVVSISKERPSQPQRRMPIDYEFVGKQNANEKCFILGCCDEMDFFLSVENIINSNVNSSSNFRIDFVALINDAIKYFKNNPNADFKRYNGTLYDATRGKVGSVACIKYKDPNGNIDASALTAYLKYFDNRQYRQMILNGNNSSLSTRTFPLQKIFYGAPGTGKSFSIRERIAEHMYGTKDDVDKVDMEADYIFRTTFHPDYDYAQFVGCYKPTKDSNGDITYEFIPQVFINALIKAYSSALIKNSTSSSQTTITYRNVSFDCRGAHYTINAVSDKNITTTKDFCLRKNAVLAAWNLLWNTGTYEKKVGPQSGRSTETAVCNWIQVNTPSCKKDDFEKGWETLMNALEQGIVTAESVSQYYQVSYIDKENLHITCQANNSKDNLQECYKQTSECGGIKGGIVDILRNYNEDSFEKAWGKLSQDVNSSYCEESEENGEVLDVEETVDSIDDKAQSQVVQPVYLVIEEINRGNCAQIFGDIFQLLDRDANGVSEYSISVDRDLREYLENNCPNAICNGKIKIPANLSIIATMNTSDQSLFPMDSAFKRRWEWEYVEIKYNTNFEIEVDTNHKYNWCDFQKAVNKIIKEKTHSEDKQMGDYFIKKDVTLDEFINKVMFYLWNDVCKENYHTEDNFFRTKDDSASTTEVEFSFGEMISDKENKINGFMIYLGVNNLIKSSVQTTPQPDNGNNLDPKPDPE